MRIIWFLLIPTVFIACKKNSANNNQPPAPVDTLSAGWRKIALPAGQGGADVFFINNTTGFAIGFNEVSRSTDGGNTWQKVYHSASSFVNIAMGSTTNAVFTTNGSKLILTSDGGNTFDSVSIADNISDAFFVSPTVVYAIGQKFWKSTNGGHNWTSIYDFMLPGGAGYKSLHFLNDQTGWWAGTGGIYKTTTGGTAWDQQPSSVFNFNITGNVYFFDASNGYVSDISSIGKTINGGTNWSKVSDLGSGSYHDLHFVTATTGYVTSGYYIYKTIDGGVTWTKEIRIASNESIIELHFTDANHGWAIYYGYILKYER